MTILENKDFVYECLLRYVINDTDSVLCSHSRILYWDKNKFCCECLINLASRKLSKMSCGLAIPGIESMVTSQKCLALCVSPNRENAAANEYIISAGNRTGDQLLSAWLLFGLAPPARRCQYSAPLIFIIKNGDSISHRLNVRMCVYVLLYIYT
jgi:hypothetical protein